MKHTQHLLHPRRNPDGKSPAALPPGLCWPVCVALFFLKVRKFTRKRKLRENVVFAQKESRDLGGFFPSTPSFGGEGLQDLLFFFLTRSTVPTPPTPPQLRSTTNLTHKQNIRTHGVSLNAQSSMFRCVSCQKKEHCPRTRTQKNEYKQKMEK